MASLPHIPVDFRRLPTAEMRAQIQALKETMVRRRSIRHFSDEPIPLDVVRGCIHVAGQAPSGANKQPWTFVLVTEPDLKRQIRVAAEEEERRFYSGRAPQSWLDDLEPLGTDADKPFLESAPALIIIFAQTKATDGSKHYYVQESVGIASGMLIAALHQAGLATLTHTPSPMNFLGELLERPDNERAYLLLPVGFPASDAVVPAIQRKALEDILVER